VISSSSIAKASSGNREAAVETKSASDGPGVSHHVPLCGEKVRRTVENDSEGSSTAIVDDSASRGEEGVVDGGGNVDLVNLATVKRLSVLLQVRRDE
jgi:hypothetical protein